MKLNEISDNPGARKKSKRLGRGIGSGKGKTAGRGVKGQKARSGVSVNGFEGGQMPIYRRLPKRGFKAPFRPEFQEIDLARLQKAVEAGRIDPEQKVDAGALIAAGVIRRSRDGVRLLANGALTARLEIEVAGASKAAVQAVEAAGGRITLTRPRTPTAETAEA